MSMAYLGPSFDIHTGGVDLIFPHHEDEIAQSEAATGEPFVRTWLHCAHLRLGGAKMAKSVGNISRVKDLLDTGVSARALRYALISVHYRQGLEYSDASLDAATAAIGRLDALVAGLDAYREPRDDAADLDAVLAAARSTFEGALDDDLNVSAALASVFDLVRELNRRLADRAISTGDAIRALAFLRDLDAVLGILPDQADHLAEDLPTGARELLDAREAARASRDWSASDRLRDELLAMGVSVEDTRDGQRWRRLEAVR
jgi:cysteinyl-tRNA synthetase